MKHYPSVLSEEETLRRIMAGASIARYGDGEFKICRGKDAVAQRCTPDIQNRLVGILKESGQCMVGIPNIDEVEKRNLNPEKVAFWRQFRNVKDDLLVEREYASSLISRPDSAPWIDTPEYWQGVESLWRGKDVTLVRGSGKGLTSEDLLGAQTITEVFASHEIKEPGFKYRQHSYVDYDVILERIGKPKTALLCLGPTATVLAVDLCARGVHAIDLGHLAIFLRKYRRGEPMTLSKDDKSHDKTKSNG